MMSIAAVFVAAGANGNGLVLHLGVKLASTLEFLL